jgi:hypothetical protein
MTQTTFPIPSAVAAESLTAPVRRPRWGSRIFVLLMCAIAVASLVISVKPLQSAVAGALTCRGGDLVITTTPGGSTRSQTTANRRQATANVAATCTRDGVTTDIHTDTMIVSTIGAGAAMGVGLGATAMIAASARRRLHRNGV